MPERSGELDTLLVMVFMVMGLPPFSMVGHHGGHACCSYLAGIARSELLLLPPLGVATLWLVEILGEEGEEGIGQYDHFVMV